MKHIIHLILLAFFLWPPVTKAQDAQGAPPADFIVSLDYQIETYRNHPTIFNAVVQAPMGHQGFTYEWDFNYDGHIDTITNTPTTYYSFRKSGTHLVSVKAISPEGKSMMVISKIRVKWGKGQQKAVQQPVYNYKSSSLKAATAANGQVTNYAVIINGCYEQRFWDALVPLYNTLDTVYGYSHDNIYFLNHNGTNPDGENPEGIIDNSATLENIHQVFSDLATLMDADDKLLVWVDDHGAGYIGPDYYKPGAVGYSYVHYSVDEDDSPDYLESDFKLRALVTYEDYFAIHGMDTWWPYHFTHLTTNKVYFYRENYVSHYNLTLSDGSIETDNDVYIEKLFDFLEGDFNKNGILDEGDIEDFDGDGNPPYNEVTGEFDEDDWGLVDSIQQNYNAIRNRIPGPYIMFDKDLDNTLELDIHSACKYGDCNNSELLVADARDDDNDGLLDWMDVNQDGDTDDYISLDEYACLLQGRLIDDDLKAMLDALPCTNINVFMQQCYSGGFIGDLSKEGRVIMTAAPPDDVAHDNTFTRQINSALNSSSLDDLDMNGDLQASMVEVFNYMVEHNGSDIPHYDDNGDGIGHVYPIPNGGDGELGRVYGLNSYLDTTWYVGGRTYTNTHFPSGSHVKECSNITLNSAITIDSLEVVKLTAGYSITLNQTFEAKHGADFEATIDAYDACGDDFLANSVNIREAVSLAESDSIIEPFNLMTELTQSASRPENVSVYPNPTSDIAYIEMILNTQTNVEIVVYNSSGVLVERLTGLQQLPPGTHQFRLDTKNYNTSTYFIQVLRNGNRSVYPLIVQ